MHLSDIAIRTVLLCAFAAPCTQSLAADSGHVPDQFVDEVSIEGFESPTSFAFDHEGNAFVTERTGIVWRVGSGKNLPPEAPLLDLSEEVVTFGDLGLLAVTLHPDFSYNGYLYLSYTAPFGGDSKLASLKVVRFTVDKTVGFTKIVAGSRKYILAERDSPGAPILADVNPGGALAFGTDGSLLIGTGDGASPRSADSGSDPNTAWKQAIEHSLISKEENIGAYRAQSIQSLSGKLLRVDPETGDGLSTNPYFELDDPSSNRSKVWALGLRNPFRVAVVPESGGKFLPDGDPGLIFTGDVGWATAEEVNVIDESARNLGWPLFEGLEQQSSYSSIKLANSHAIDPEHPGVAIPFDQLITQYTENPNPFFPHPAAADQPISPDLTYIHRRPILEYRDDARVGLMRDNTAAAISLGSADSPVAGYCSKGSCSIAGTWFSGLGYPATRRNSYYHADLRGGWIHQLVLDEEGKLATVRPFLSSRKQIIQVATHPTEGVIYYLDHREGELRKIDFTGDVNLPPRAVAKRSSDFGPSPLTIQFDATESTDPDGEELEYLWDFGNGQTSNSAKIDHTFHSPEEKAEAFPVTLTVTDPKGLSSTQSFTINTNNTPPQVRITSFKHGDKYEETTSSPTAKSAVLPLAAEVIDKEHKDSELTFRWQAILHHNKHTHQMPPISDRAPKLNLPSTPCGFDSYAWRIELTVSDPKGLSTTVQSWLYPNCQCLNRATAEMWRISHFKPDELKTKGDWLSDPDADGLTNLMEYALGHRPFEENQVEPPLNIRQLPSGQLEISYTRPEWLPDLSYGLEISNDGTNWRLVEDAGDKFLPTIHPATDSDAEIVVYREFPGDSTPLKARLRVELTKEKIVQFTDPVSITNSPLAIK